MGRLLASQVFFLALLERHACTEGADLVDADSIIRTSTIKAEEASSLVYVIHAESGVWRTGTRK